MELCFIRAKKCILKLADKVKEYFTIAKAASIEINVKRSKFIASLYPIENAEAALKLVAQCKSKYSDATHNCYAYIADELGNIKKFSDDAEPQGTAGLPILSVLEANRLKKCLAVVTRYFGGIKLGASGLVAAYADACKKGIEQCGIVTMQFCSVLCVEVDWGMAAAIERHFRKNIIDSSYQDGGKFFIAVADEDKALAELAQLSLGKAKITKSHEDWFVKKS